MTRPPASSIQAWVARRRKGLLAVILVGYSLITIGYGLLNPLFEAPDEQHHFFTILYVAENGRLPIATPSDEWLRQEAAQPPLTYVLAALLARGASSAQAQAQIWPNPHAILGDASAQTNINRFVHSADEAWPWQGYALTAHWLRLFSTLVGLGTLLFIYASGRLLWPQQPEIALLATGLVAFLPQYNFLHSAISNDVLAIFFCTAALWQLLRLWQTFSSWPRLLLLGITIGLTVLSKTVGLLLLVYALGVLFLLWIKNQPRIQHQSPHVNRGAPTLNLQGLLFQLLLVLIPALLLGGWLWWRNWQLYGDVTATAPFVQFAGGNRQATPLQVWGEWASLWPSLIAVFGWFNLRPPQWIYWIWVGLALTAVAGDLRGLSKRPLKRELHRQSLFALLTRRWFIAVLLFIWVILVYAGLFTFMLQTEAAQGRLLFPALLPIALGMAYGLSRWRWPGVGLLAQLLALITTLYSLFFVIRPAYALPPAVPALPSAATRIGVEVGQGVWLEGVQVETAVAHPGDNIWLTLYWQASEPLQEPVEFVLEILGSDLVPVGRLQSFHGRGLYPANLWPPGQIIADRFAVQVDETAVTPVLAPIFVGLAGQETRAAVGEIEIQPADWPPVAGPPLAKLGENIELTDVSLMPGTALPGQVITVTVQWHASGAPGDDYTTFVHLGEAGQPPLATGDSQPRDGRYPTRLWPAGAVIDDAYTLTLPADLPDGRYPIWIGLYNSTTLERLPLTRDSQRQPNDAFLAGWIDVTR